MSLRITLHTKKISSTHPIQQYKPADLVRARTVGTVPAQSEPNRAGFGSVRTRFVPNELKVIRNCIFINQFKILSSLKCKMRFGRNFQDFLFPSKFILGNYKILSSYLSFQNFLILRTENLRVWNLKKISNLAHPKFI